MEKYTEMCGDNRFELIKKYKDKLVEATNIEMAKDEMNVIDNILFRFWQMGWLDKLEVDVLPKSEVEKLQKVVFMKEDLMKKIVRERNQYFDTIEMLKGKLERARQEVAREVIDEYKMLVINYVKDGDLLLVAFKNAVAHAETELKNKYEVTND